MDEYIQKVCNNLDFSKNSINDLGNGIILSNREIDILNKYKIDYMSCCDLKSLIIKIEITLEQGNYEDMDDLDEISEIISERNYYKNTNK